MLIATNCLNRLDLFRANYTNETVAKLGQDESTVQYSINRVKHYMIEKEFKNAMGFDDVGLADLQDSAFDSMQLIDNNPGSLWSLITHFLPRFSP